MRELNNITDDEDNEVFISFTEEDITRLKALTEDERDNEFLAMADKYSESWEGAREFCSVLSETLLSINKEYLASL